MHVFLIISKEEINLSKTCFVQWFREIIIRFLLHMNWPSQNVFCLTGFILFEIAIRFLLYRN